MPQLYLCVMGKNTEMRSTEPELCTDPRYVIWRFSRPSCLFAGDVEYRSTSVIRTVWGGRNDGPDYRGNRTTEGKLRGIANVQKIITRC